MKMAEELTAVILAGGPGSRFWPYNVVRQKAAFPIANVPLVRRLVEQVVHLGVERILVVTGHAPGSVRAALRGAPGEIRFVHQAQPTGTADAILLAAQGVEGDLLVLHGDMATHRENLRALIQIAAQEKTPATVLVQGLERESPRDWIVAHAHEGRLLGLEGHSRSGHLRLCGAYVLRPPALDYLRDNPGFMAQVPVGGMPPAEADAAQSLQMMLDEGQPVAAVTAFSYHVDVDKPWHILQANHLVIEEMRERLEED
ncbi:MAG: nucleotidyl transferase, partial [Caldilineae bacterium]